MLNVNFCGPLLILKDNPSILLQVFLVVCFLYYVMFYSVNISVFLSFQSIVGSNCLLMLTILLDIFLYVSSGTNMEEFLSSLGTNLLARVLGYVQLYKAKNQIFFPFILLSVRFKVFFQPSSSLMVL